MEYLKKIAGEKYLYRHENPDGTQTYFVRKVENGKDTTECLNTKRIGTARKLRDGWVHGRTSKKLGIIEKVEEEGPALITTILDDYEKAGYPDRQGNPKKPGDHLTSELASIVALRGFWDGKEVGALTQNNWDKYRDWRKENCSRKGSDCNRATDLDKNCLSNACKWAVRKEKLADNPMAKIGKFSSYLKAKHCKAYSPQKAEELHAAVRAVFACPKSEALGWQALYEAACGCRTAEILQLRLDAQPDEPGYIIGDNMCVRRCKKAGRENPFVSITPEFRVIIDAHKVWHDRYYPTNPWCFPNIRKAPNGKVGCPHAMKASLTKCLDHLFDKGILKRKYTSHGMRAFYVLWRRSHGISDAQICTEINQIGGTRTLEISYGIAPPSWLGGKGPKLTLLPDDPANYAWAPLLASK
jgi:integrase